MFDWINSTVEQLAEHISLLSAQSVQSQIRYYKGTNNEEMILKVYEARKIAKILRAERRVMQMKQQLHGGE